MKKLAICTLLTSALLAASPLQAARYVGSASSDSTSTALRPWQWAAIGVGVLAVTAGILLVVLNKPEGSHAHN
jgi:hypothetical protein